MLTLAMAHVALALSSMGVENLTELAQGSMPIAPPFFEAAELVRRGQLQLVPGGQFRGEFYLPVLAPSLRLRVGLGGWQELRVDVNAMSYLSAFTTNLSWKIGFKDILSIIGSVGAFAGPKMSGYSLGLGTVFSTGVSSILEKRRTKPYLGIRASVSQPFGCVSPTLCTFLVPAVAIGVHHTARRDTTIMTEIGYNGRIPLPDIGNQASQNGYVVHVFYVGVGVGLDLLQRVRSSGRPPARREAEEQSRAPADWLPLLSAADEAMGRGDYAAAVPFLWQLYQRTADPVWLCDVGEAQRRRLAWAAAREAFSRCLAAAPRASYAPLIRQILQQLPGEEYPAGEVPHGAP